MYLCNAISALLAFESEDFHKAAGRLHDCHLRKEIPTILASAQCISVLDRHTP